MTHSLFQFARTASALLVAVSWAGSLQGTSLEGHIFDPQGAAVADARLLLFERNSGIQYETRSGTDGSYIFRTLPPGSYLLTGEASSAALTGSRKTTVRGAATLDLALALSVRASEVVVTASSTPLPVQQVAKALDVIDSEEIALRNEFALSEALRSVPGVRVRQLRGPGSLTALQTRGLRNHDTAVLIDGLRFRDAAATQGDASSFYSVMNIVDTERIEFLRGPGSSLYGSHSIAGTVSIHSRQGGGRPRGDLRAEGGGLGMLRGTGRFGGGLAQDRLAYSGGVSHLDVTRGYRGSSPHRNTGGQVFAKFAIRPNVTLSGRFWGTNSFARLTESPSFSEDILANFPAAGRVPARALPVTQLELFEGGQAFDVGNATFIPGALDPDNRRESSFVAAALAVHHQLSTASSYRLAYQLVETSRSFLDGPAGPGSFEPAYRTLSRFEGRTQTLQARADHRMGPANLVTVGYEGEGELYKGRNADEGPGAIESRSGIDQASHAAFAQDQIRLMSGDLLVSLSGRAQFFRTGSPWFLGAQSPYEDRTARQPGEALTGDVAVAYFARSTGTKLRAHGGNAFRAPSSFERFGATFSSFSGGFSYWGDPLLRPERSVAIDGGIDQWLASARVRLSGTVFYTALQETIIFDFANFPAGDPFGRFGGYRNTGGGIARGAELSARLVPTASTALKAAYTYTNSDSRTPTIGTDFFEVPGVSKHMFSATASQWIARRVNVTFDLFSASDYTLSPFGAQARQVSFGGPIKADLVLRYELPVGETKRVEVYGKVENVFGHDYYENGFGSPGAWAIGGIRFSF